MPFASYKDFDDCVSKNSDKSDPAAYCASIQQKAEGMKTKIEEYRTADVFDLHEAQFQVEEATGRMLATIRVIEAGRSKNNRNYRPAALRKAGESGLFNGTRMFVNHSDTPPLKRPLTDMVSAVESTWYNDATESIDGKVEFFDKNFFEYVQRASKYMGNSINALVRGTRKRLPSGQVEEDIQEIVKPHSVDWVIFPAAGGGILAFESEVDPVIDWGAITLDELKKNAPSIVEALQAENTPPPPPVAGLTPEEVDKIVAEKLTAYEQERKLIASKQEAAAAQIREAFAKSGLPEKTRVRVMSSFEGVQEFDEAAVNAVITEAKEELKAAGAGPRITGMGPSGAGEATTPAFSIRESVEAHFGLKTSTDGDKSKKED